MCLKDHFMFLMLIHECQGYHVVLNRRNTDHPGNFHVTVCWSRDILFYGFSERASARYFFSVLFASRERKRWGHLVMSGSLDTL